MVTDIKANRHYTGVDVSKAYLDVFISESAKHLRVKNDSLGLKQLDEELKGVSSRCLVIESTGGLEHKALRYLDKRGYFVSVVNPRCVRRLAQGMGLLAKTDKLDAQILSTYGSVVCPVETKPRTQQQQLLWDKVARRRQLIDMRTQEKNRLSSASGWAKKQHESLIRHFDKQITRIEKEVLELIESDEELSRKREILVSVPGVAEQTAFQLLTDLPELGQASDRKIAALVGVAPYCCDSGNLRGKRKIWGGRQSVRNALFIVAMGAATKHNPKLKMYYKRLLDQGKPKRVALVACMRKLIVILNHMLKDDTLWQAETK